MDTRRPHGVRRTLTLPGEKPPTAGTQRCRPSEKPAERSALVVAQHRAETLRLGEPGLVRRRVGRAGGLEGLELLAEVGLEPRAVLALEGPQVVDLVRQGVTLALEVTEQLGTTLGGLGVQGLRATAGVRLELVGVGLGLGLEALGLGAGLADDLVGFVLGLLDELVRVARGDLEQAGSGARGVRDGDDADLLRHPDVRRRSAASP